jgi:hypothetical protein
MSVTTNQILQCFHSKDNIVNSGTAFLIGNSVKCVQLVEDKEVKETVQLKLKGRPAVLSTFPKVFFIQRMMLQVVPEGEEWFT